MSKVAALRRVVFSRRTLAYVSGGTLVAAGGGYWYLNSGPAYPPSTKETRRPPPLWTPPSRQHMLDALKASDVKDGDAYPQEFDLLIVGGGATGAGVAVDAASRGLKVALVERDDFSSGEFIAFIYSVGIPSFGAFEALCSHSWFYGPAHAAKARSHGYYEPPQTYSDPASCFSVGLICTLRHRRQLIRSNLHAYALCSSRYCRVLLEPASAAVVLTPRPPRNILKVNEASSWRRSLFAEGDHGIRLRAVQARERGFARASNFPRDRSLPVPHATDYVADLQVRSHVRMNVPSLNFWQILAGTLLLGRV